ncbi:MAG TPA: M20 family metallopeptidase [Thermodesulfobacteriota bacterium]|nr:M20 family metallopeptidase [Thermodesulfobacteriota bacterium]
MASPIQTKIAGMKDWLVEIRRTIHMNPELGFEEVETSRLVAGWLERFALQVTKGVAETGVVGLLQGGMGGKTVAIRADMDALPLEEANQVPYRSRVKGKMHACGHDGHVAILLGVAKLFSSLREEVKGNIKWIFQPAEEGGGGGRVLVEEGVLENPKVDAIFGAHLFPDLQIGKIGIHEKEGLAATDRVIIKMIGRGGHGAYPHLSRDPILAAGHLITQINSIVSRSIAPLDSAVISIGKIQGGTAFNIIPDEVEILGTVRSLNPRVQEDLKSRLEQVTQGVARSFDLDYRFDFQYGYPPLVNDPEMSHLVASACAKGIGKENVEFINPSMGGEDFAYYLQKVPGSFFRLGCRNEEKGIIHPFHNSSFEIDEDVLPLGVEMFARIIDQYLGLKLF